MKIHEQRQGAVMVVRPEGPMVQTDAEQVRALLDKAVDSTMGRLVLDLSTVPFVDSVGLEALADINERLGEGGQSLKLAATSKTVREVLELTDLSSLFEHFDDVTDAVRSFL